MKILYHHRIASKDGQYVHVEELTLTLKRMGHDIVFVGPKVVDSSEFGSDGGMVAWLKRFIPGFAYELLELCYSIVAYIKLRKAVKEHQPDCLYERYNLYMPAGIWIKRQFNLPMILEINAPLFAERSKFDGIAIPFLARWSEHYTWRNADHIVPVTQVLAAQIAATGVNAERMTVIPNGINLQRFSNVPDIDQAKARLDLDNKLVLGFTGFVREWHRLDRVIDLLAQPHDGPQRHLLLVGDGPARESLEQHAQSLGVSSQVTITGIVARDRVADYVAAFDIALQPDVVAYASPLKLFEYLALGRAIVAPDTANIREVLTHESNALLFDTNDMDTSFPAAVETLCSNPQLRSTLGQQAEQTIIDGGYTWDNNAQTVTGLFETLGVRNIEAI
ncbi:MAG: glycosyltransferase family 4 protein [Gammaproteobacteria bacterium]|nr:glycosyltransferase family 4 protein [Gammaproteobacteria bacterium]